ncbi:MAG: metallophosphoesterase [Firmicutes bacterium]|nr:metallophosphoesterase [Bacillota bacterium]
MRNKLCILLSTIIFLFSVSGDIVYADENAALPLPSVTDEAVSGSGILPPGGGKPPWLIKETDDFAPVIVTQPSPVKYVLENSGYRAPEFSVSAKLPDICESGAALSFDWYIDGVKTATDTFDALAGCEHTSVFCAKKLQNRDAGVYRVYCKVYEDYNGETHVTDSYEVNFIVCRGIKKNSAVTFSDVHEAFSNIGTAISDCIKNNGGLIPALIICSGDWVTPSHNMGESEENYKKVRDTLISRIALQTGGIDTVYVAGNHDNAKAAAEAVRAANLGADADYSGAGIIYDGRKSYTNGDKKPAPDIIVIGINYEDAAVLDDNGNVLSADYTPVISKLKRVFENIKQNYNGELIILSAHSGLHTLGIQPQSAENGSSAWAGSYEYNIDASDKMVELLNGYAEDMDIIYFFGHDHSKREGEFMLLPGDTIVSTVSFADRTYVENVLKFTYAHAGYITNIIGGREYYSFINLDENSFERTMYIADESGGTADRLTFSLKRKNTANAAAEPVKYTGGKSSGKAGTPKTKTAPIKAENTTQTDAVLQTCNFISQRIFVFRRNKFLLHTHNQRN